ncbi:hypothetical protein BDZ89DRAFT_239295 [Hymenopellis radicata]|nr:hypothetical protein BDZ89DRAFT_239295 [Hymenopellis radicata]
MTLQALVASHVYRLADALNKGDLTIKPEIDAKMLAVQEALASESRRSHRDPSAKAYLISRPAFQKLLSACLSPGDLSSAPYRTEDYQLIPDYSASLFRDDRAVIATDSIIPILKEIQRHTMDSREDFMTLVRAVCTQPIRKNPTGKFLLNFPKLCLSCLFRLFLQKKLKSVRF